MIVFLFRFNSSLAVVVLKFGERTILANRINYFPEIFKFVNRLPWKADLVKLHFFFVAIPLIVTLFLFWHLH